MLASVIILSAILALVAASIGYIAYASRLNILENEYKEQSMNLAESCLGYVILNLRTDPDFAPPRGGLQVRVSQDNFCLVAKVVSQGAERRVLVQGKYQNSFTNLSAVLDPSQNFQINFYIECRSLTAPDFEDTC